MTIYEIYEQTIKTLTVDERLRLAKLILNDLAPDDEVFDQDYSDRSGEIRDLDHLEELLLTGLNSGPDIEVTPQYWENKRANLLGRHARVLRKHESRSHT